MTKSTVSKHWWWL